MLVLSWLLLNVVQRFTKIERNKKGEDKSLRVSGTPMAEMKTPFTQETGPVVEGCLQAIGSKTVGDYTTRDRIQTDPLRFFCFTSHQRCYQYKLIMAIDK